MLGDLVSGMDEFCDESEGEFGLHSFRKTESDDEYVISVLKDMCSSRLNGGEDCFDDEFGTFNHSMTRIVVNTIIVVIII